MTNEEDLRFKKIALEDCPALNEKLGKLNCKLLNYNSAVMFIYRNLICFEYAFSGDFLVTRTTFQGKRHYLFPVGDGDPRVILNQVKERELAEHDTCRFFQFCEHQVEPMLAWAKDLCLSENLSYTLYEVRDEFEYIYLTDELARLEGRDFKPKRNHVNHFLKHYTWTEEPISRDNLPEVISYSQQWKEEKAVDKTSRLLLEDIALQEALTHFEDLKLQGLLIRVGNDIVAFSLGCPLCADTFLVLFEEADRNINGAYAMINQRFAQTVAANYRYLNRAEDCGVEGLRKAKLSYHPHVLQEVFHLDLQKKS
jgi:hypothetical protein